MLDQSACVFHVNTGMASCRRCEEEPNYIAKLWPSNLKAKCEVAKSQPGFIKRADAEVLREVFDKYASVTKGEEKFMTGHDFVDKYLSLLTKEEFCDEAVHLLAGAADTSKDGLISFPEFQAFEGLLCAPDSMYEVAFRLFDRNGSGTVTLDEFKHVITMTEVHRKVPFNFQSEFIKLNFGSTSVRQVSYLEFTQLLHDYYEEHALQAFRAHDRDNRGVISAVAFCDIMTNLKAHLLTQFVSENLVAVASHQVTYPYFTAFISLLNNMELVKQIYNSATRGSGQEITKEEFLCEAQKYTQITPLEVDILFQLTDLLHQTGRISMSDIYQFAPIVQERTPWRMQAQLLKDTVQDSYAITGRSFFLRILENVYRFSLGAIAGAVGATAVYPIDLVKTRMQNQRNMLSGSGSHVGEVMYKNSFVCFKKVIRHEGVAGLYRGIIPQLVGVAPEKAIKLTVNDIMRDVFTTDGEIQVPLEMISGGMAGASQVMFTNPLEIVKIRLQVAGEMSRWETSRPSAISIIRELRLRGLYKGARACLLRDIPFSAIYFTLYAHAKKQFADETGYNSPLSLLCAATLSGAPAASLTTPADVIKTRLQVQAREGQTRYDKGLIDCARTIFREEGFRAFWKGAPARVFRSSPQFGVTLVTYELLQRMFYVDFGGRRLEGSAIETPPEEQLPANPDHVGGYRLAAATFDSIHTKFGLSVPKFHRISSEK